MASKDTNKKDSERIRIRIPENRSTRAPLKREDSEVLETKTICGKEVDIEVTSGRHGEIRKLRITECKKDGNSVTIFHEEYDKLEEGESPRADPGFVPGLLSSTLTTDHPLPPSANRKMSVGVRRADRKPKLLMRLQLEDEEGIVSKHATFFPTKIKEKDFIHTDVHSDHYYEMSSFPRGTLTLLNVKNFRTSSGMSAFPRDGTDRDAEGLCALFLELGFIVERYDNPTKKIMSSALESASADERLSCCACAILTHSDKGEVYATDGTIKIADINKLFSNKNLAGKPKLFIYQACQPLDRNDVDSTESAMDDQFFSFPCVSDSLYAWSTTPGYFSWWKEPQGSWFVRAICSVFREHADNMDAFRMLTRVNDKMLRRDLSSTENQSNEKSRVLTVVSQMRKDLLFFPPYGPMPRIKSFTN